MKAALLWILALSTVLHSAPSPSADTLVREGLALARSGRLAEAESTLRRGLTEYPHDERFPLELAGLAYRQKDLGRARKLLHSALRLKPADAYANQFLGSLYLLEGNLAASLRYWNRVGHPVVGDIRFVPAPQLDDVQLARLPAVSTGQVLTSQRLNQTETNLRELGIFADVRFRLTPRADQRYDFAVETEPRGQGGGRWWWRLFPYARSLPYQAVNVDVFNIRRSALNVTSLWRWDGEKRRFAADVTGRATASVGYRFGADMREERWDLRRTWYGDSAAAARNVNLRKLEVGAEALFRIGDTARWSSGLYVSGRHYRPGVGAAGDEFSDGWLVEMRNRLEGNLASWPELRIRLDGWGLLRTGRFISGPGEARFTSPSAGVHGQWFPPSRGEKYEVNVLVQAGGVFGRVPLDEMYMLGMERDNSLWLRGHVGTREGRKGNAPLGTQFFLWNSDVQRELWRGLFLRVQAGPFFDVGGTRDPGKRFGSRGLLYDTGLQITLRTIRGIRISAVYGRDLRDGRPAFYTSVSR